MVRISNHFSKVPMEDGDFQTLRGGILARDTKPEMEPNFGCAVRAELTVAISLWLRVQAGKNSGHRAGHQQENLQQNCLWLAGALPGTTSKSPAHLAHLAHLAYLESNPGHREGSPPPLHSPSLPACALSSFPSTLNFAPMPRPLPVVPSHTAFICLSQAAIVCGATSLPGWSAGRRHALHSHY